MKHNLILGLLLASTTAFGQAGVNDPTFNPGTGATPFSQLLGYNSSMVLQPDGKILIGADFTDYNGTGRNRIARLNSDGSLDPTFDPGTGASSNVASIVLQPDGKILIGGQFTTYNGVALNGLARLNNDGSLDPTFDPGTGAGWVNTIALQPDGKILIGGRFDSYGGTPRHSVARINNDGSLDPTFDPGTGTYEVATIALQPDGKILVGGHFRSFNGVRKNRIARLNSNGSLDSTFHPGSGANNTSGWGLVSSIVLQPDGKILVGGLFHSFNWVPRENIVRLNPSGSVDLSFDPGIGTSAPHVFNGSILTMALQPDGKVLLGGFFQSYDGVRSKRLTRVNSDGSLDVTFYSGSGANERVSAIALQPDGNILIFGSFSSYDGVSRNCITRVLGASLPGLILTLSTDAFGSETTWELTTANGDPVAAGGPYPDGAATEITEHITAPEGYYRFALHDAGGNGIDGGGYVLTDGNGQRILDANGEFGALSATDEAFSIPVGPVGLLAEDCDDLAHSASDPVKCSIYSSAEQYQFLVFDPHGSYLGSANATWAQLGADRLAQLPVDLELNIRVRALLPNNYFTAFGPTCTFKITGPGMAPHELRSLAKGSEGGLMAWPNPAQGGHVQVTFDGLDPAMRNVQVQVYDATGRQTFTTQWPVSNGSVDQALDLNGMAQGVYLLQVVAGDAVHSTRLVVGD